MDTEVILKELKAASNPRNVEGMARFGINPKNTLGVSMPTLRSMARRISKDHVLAQELWLSGVHEARILACLIDDARMVTDEQMERWALDFDSWDICDQCCSNLFDKTAFAYEKADQWSRRREEFVKRAGFVLMAALAVHDRKASNAEFINFLSAIESNATDDRNFVKKAVNWALRQIGKRNLYLNQLTIEVAWEIKKAHSSSARWIATDALRELTSEPVQQRLRK